MNTPAVDNPKEFESISADTTVWYTGKPLEEFMRTPCLIHKSVNGDLHYSLIFNKIGDE